jgi:hypothetical protein
MTDKAKHVTDTINVLLDAAAEEWLTPPKLLEQVARAWVEWTVGLGDEWYLPAAVGSSVETILGITDEGVITSDRIIPFLSFCSRESRPATVEERKAGYARLLKKDIEFFQVFPRVSLTALRREYVEERAATSLALTPGEFDRCCRAAERFGMPTRYWLCDWFVVRDYLVDQVDRKISAIDFLLRG